MLLQRIFCARPAMRRVALTGLLLQLLAACGNGTPGAIEPPAQLPGLGKCTTDVSTDAALVPALVPTLAQVRQRQEVIDQFGGGFRAGGNAAEVAYIHYLTAQLKALGVSEVIEEPYTFAGWSAKSFGLEEVQGPAPGPLHAANFIPSTGSSGPAGVTGELVYMSALSTVNYTEALAAALQAQDPANIFNAIAAVLDSYLGSGTSLAQAIAAMDLKGKIVMFDVARVPMNFLLFYSQASYVNDANGTAGPLTPFPRPVFDMAAFQKIINALNVSGAAGMMAVLDYPREVADDQYLPFGAVYFNGALCPASPGCEPVVPGIILDRDTGAALKQQLAASAAAPITLHLTLDSAIEQKTSYNISGLVPGQCAAQILLGSHSDGPNSIEENGAAAILSIASYFAHAPVEQRRRGLKIVITGGHMVDSPGIAAYITAHQQELTQKVLTAIEIEHLGAREWIETSPGVMALSGLPEAAGIWSVPAGRTPAQSTEALVFAQKFDRNFVLTDLPLGEGLYWNLTASLPMTQFITGPTYLLNGPMAQVTSQFTDWELEQRQITAFIQMIANLNMRAAADFSSPASR